MLILEHLRVNQQLTPQYVGQHPCFSWNLRSDRNGCYQAAYRICIWENTQLVWDSGERASASSIRIPYEGPALRPLRQYRWQLWCRDCFGDTAHAQSSFRTHRMDLPWHAHWVQPRQEATPEEYHALGEPQAVGSAPRDYREFRPTQLIRLPFSVQSSVSSAWVHISAHGLYRLEVNGKRIGEDELTPDCTPYDKLIFYQTYDIREALRPGENVIGVELADGWWSGRLGLGSSSCQYGNKTALFLECELTDPQNQTMYFGAENARSIAGCASYADLFVGECYDASRFPVGWSEAGFADDTWTPVEILNEPLNTLCPQQGSTVRVMQTFRPVALLKTPAGETVLDLGQNIAGFLEIRLSAAAGHRIIMEHSEVLGEDGNFLQNIMGFNKDQRDVYITRDGPQIWRPRFTYHGFRYVRITGWPGVPQLDQFRACVLSTALEEAGTFACSNPMLNQLHHNIRWSQIANAISIPTDCPQREKAGWLGDIMAFAPTMLYLSEASEFLRRWLGYVRMEQLANGLIPSIAPYWKSYRKIFAGLGSETSCGWGDAILLVPWSIYQSTGDRSILEENYDAMERWMSYVQREAETGQPAGFDTFDSARKARQKYLWNTGFHYGDWLMPSIMMRGGMPQETAAATKELVASAYYAFATKTMAQIAAALGKEQAASNYLEQFVKIREAFQAEFIRPDGSLVREFQGAYVLCLWFGLVPETQRQAMSKHLCRMISENDGCLDTGFLSIPFLLDVLTGCGRTDVALQLLFQERCPSWLYMVKNHATTIWESWDCIKPDGTVGMYSYNHYAYGCVGDWIYRKLGGLEALEPGYRRMRIAPLTECGLEWARTAHRTPYGTAAVEWHRYDSRWELDVVIPVGTVAEICLPDGTIQNKTSGVYHFEQNLPTSSLQELSDFQKA